LVYGDEVRKWRINSHDEWIIYAPWDFDIQRYHAIKKHLTQFKEQLEARPECAQGRFKWWCLARYAPSYAHLFDLPKIVYPEIAKESRFAFDASGVYPLKTVFSIPVNDLFLLGVLNSRAAWEYLKNECTVLGDADQNGRLTLQEIFVSKLPIPHATESDKREIAKLVKACLDSNGENCRKAEIDIDLRVAALYGIDIDDLSPAATAKTPKRKS
jgi:hypothetical protein